MNLLKIPLLVKSLLPTMQLLHHARCKPPNPCCTEILFFFFFLNRTINRSFFSKPQRCGNIHAMNACPLLLQTPGFPKGLHEAWGWTARGSRDRPWCCAFHCIIVCCPGTNCLSTKTDDGLIKTKHEKIYHSSFTKPACSLRTPVQVLLTGL